MSKRIDHFRSTFYFEGKRYEVRGKTQKEADQKAAVKLDKLKRGEVGISSGMTIARWANEWVETYKRPIVGASQLASDLHYIKNVINPAIGGLRIGRLKTSICSV
jgi:hypothetical protein